jgi:hypothetical protein
VTHEHLNEINILDESTESRRIIQISQIDIRGQINILIKYTLEDETD